MLMNLTAVAVSGELTRNTNESIAPPASTGYLETHPKLQLFFAIVLSLSAAFGIFGNILVILTVTMTKTLRIPSNMFIVNLALADLVVTTVVDPFNVIGAFVGPTYFAENYVLCQMIASLCAPACLCSMFSICAIGINRYIMICHYHRYDRMFTWEKTGGMCLLLWFISYCLHFPNHVGWGHNDFDPAYYICTFSIATHSYAVFYITLGVFVPLVVILFSYISIFRRYWQVKREIRNKRQVSLEMRNSPSMATPSATGTTHTADQTRLQVPLLGTPAQLPTATGRVSPCPASQTSCSSIPISPSSLQLQGNGPIKRGFTSDDIKLAKTLFTVFIAFLVCWGPFALLVLMKQPSWVPGWMYMIAIIMAHGNSSINSILYGLTNEKFRAGYRSVLGLRMAIKSKTGKSSNLLSRRVDSNNNKLNARNDHPPGPTITSAPISSSSLAEKAKSNGVPARKENGIAPGSKNKKVRADKEFSRTRPSMQDQLLVPNGIIITVPDSP
ncbi:putative Alpha-1B adrenergic receptor [Hypsibius exemplaris]|uniref:Alpha-1B adrenergic receptor n=1 Tax=Hypsibius exemplaris TaxID=2072580 RepID=A0A1W0XFE2_HYPEX|nr:putative Alpha-1B adrenergic receptor [Hypsibius exemplaris]